MAFGLLILILVFLVFITLISILIYCLYGLFKSSKENDKIINTIENNKASISSIFSDYMPSNSSKDTFYDDIINNYMNSIDF